LAILDRGLFDALVWFDLLSVQGQISRETRDVVHRFLLIDKWRAATDAVFLFKAEPEVSMERENKDKLIDEPGRAMNHEFLGTLNEAYERVRREAERFFPRFEVIDTSRGTTPQSTAQQVTVLILDLFEVRLTAGGSSAKKASS
jgi:thymidylate kinase